MGDYHNNYLDQKESESIQTVLVPYNLSSANDSIPTLCTENSKSLLDYIVTDDANCNDKTFVFRWPVKSDHLATLLIKKVSIGKNFYHLGTQSIAKKLS